MKDEIIIEDFVDNSVIELEERMQMPVLENLEVTPTAEEQIFKSEKYGYNEVKVKGTEGLAEDLNVELTEQDNLITNQETTIEDIINALEDKSAGIVPEGTLDITENGEYDVFEKAIANVNVPVGVFPEGTLDINANDEYDVVNYEKVNVDVPIPEGYIKPEGNIDITTTEEYDVTNYMTAKIKDDNLKAENIAENVEILGLKGTFKGGVDTSDATATSDDLLLGKTAYVNEEKITGTIETWDGTFEGDAERYQPLNDYLRGIKTEITAEDMQDVLEIREYEFYKNPITSVEIGSLTTQIGQYAFSGTQLTSINIPNNVMTLGGGAFDNCKNLTTATLSKGISSIPNSLFSGCSALTGIEIPEKVTSIGNSAFNKCTSLTEIIIPDGVKSIGQFAFADCDSITTITIPDSVTSLGSWMFNGCDKLTSAIIGHGVPFVDANTFRMCFKLASVVLGRGVTKIHGGAFESGALKSITCYAETPPTLTSAFGGIPTDCIFYVPAGSVEAYKSATNWNARADYIVAYEEV